MWSRLRPPRRWPTFLVAALLLTACGGGAADLASGGDAIWRPGPGLTWQWQLSDHPVDTSIEADIYDIDGQLADAQVVAELHAQGRHVVCYLSAGSWEGYRPDAADFPDDVIGDPLDPPFADERWLDILQVHVLRPLMADRVADCAADGFDAVEFDNVDGVGNDTGFPLTSDDQLAYNRMLADLAHDAGMAAVLKNDLGQAAALEPDFEVLLLEQCVEFDECAAARPFLDAGKLVLDAEYAVGVDEACAVTQPLGISLVVKAIELDAPVQTCR